MSTGLPLEMYRGACERFSKLHGIEDVQQKIEEVRQIKELWASSVSKLLNIAELADHDVWHALGDAFANGRGTGKNKEEGKRWFERAATSGHVGSMVRLGLILNHQHTPETHSEAVAWFRRAADLGIASGMVWLGFAYREGNGVSSNPVLAAHWFVKAAEAGNHQSFVHAGRVYARYLSSPIEALKCFLQAAEAGCTESFLELAMLRDDRRSPVYDPYEAVKWYLLVVERSTGSGGRAMLALARHYRGGVGVAHDLNMAKQWLHRLLQGNIPNSSFRKEATQLLQQMQGEML